MAGDGFTVAAYGA